MKQHIRSLDLARGFTILCMPAVHTAMMYADPALADTVLGYLLVAVAEGPGAPLLMLLMGVYFTFRKEHRWIDVVVRVFNLMLAGHLLNILKFGIPYACGMLPHGLLQEFRLEGENALRNLVDMGDILHFAGWALLILQGVYRLPRFHIWAACLAVIVVSLSPLVWDTQSGIPLIDDLLKYATGQPPRVFFPLFPWLAYPLAGVVAGYYCRRSSSQTMVLCGGLGAALTVAGFMGEKFFPVQYSTGFYRTPPLATVWHLGIVLLSLFAWHVIDKYAKPNLFFRLLTYSSRNITALYGIQWVMICWALPVVGFRTLDLFTSCMVMVAMTVNTYLFCYTFQLLKEHYGQSKSI